MGNVSAYNINAALARSPEGIAFGKVAQRVKAADFTDGGSKAGTLTMNQQIPAKSFVLGTFVNVIEAFDDDTSAALKVGKTSGEDEFSDGTSIDVSSAGAAGDSPEDPLEFLASAQSVYLQLTSATDFSLIAAGDGEMIVEVWYLTADRSDLTRGYPDRNRKG